MKLRPALASFALLALAACEPDALTMLADSGVRPDAGPPDRMSEPDASPSLDATPARDAAPAAPDAEPGVPDAGCTDTHTTEMLDVGADTSHRFTGVARGADGNGEFHVMGPNGEQVQGVLPTDPQSGAYDVEIPLFCGDQLVIFTWSAGACRIEDTIAVHRGGCAPNDIQVTLTWDATGLDWELHLIERGGRINDNATDCTWTSCISVSPDWGVAGDPSDNPHKDVDNTGAFGPENIYLPRATNGTYTVMVEHWGQGAPDSDGQVTINVRGQTTLIDVRDLAPEHVRTAATIDWPSGTVTPITTVTDCSANWMLGCQAALP